MGICREKIDDHYKKPMAGARREAKRGVTRFNRRAAKRDPENALKRHEYKGWVT